MDLNSKYYSIVKKPIYNYFPSKELDKIYNAIKKEYPNIRTIIWDTAIINEFTLHYAMTNYIIVETEKIALELIVNLLKERFFKKYTIITEEILVKNKEIYLNSERILVVKGLHTKSPLINDTKITIEKIMVDLYKDELYMYFQGKELETIYENIFNKYEINMKKLVSYAKYRTNIEEYIEFIYRLHIPDKYKLKER